MYCLTRLERRLGNPCGPRGVTKTLQYVCQTFVDAPKLPHDGPKTQRGKSNCKSQPSPTSKGAARSPVRVASGHGTQCANSSQPQGRHTSGAVSHTLETHGSFVWLCGKFCVVMCDPVR